MKKSVILVLACVIAVVLLILATGLISNVVHEKRFGEREKHNLQAVDLADAGLNHGIVELRRLILNTLDTNVRNEPASNIADYADGDVDDKDSLDFLVDMLSFTAVSADEIKTGFSSSGVGLNTGISGSYTGDIVIRKQRDAAGNPIEGYSPGGFVYRFPYEFLVEVDATSSSVGKTLRFLAGKFEVTIQRGSFARYALFTVYHTTIGGTKVWFTNRTKFNGPVHTNQRFNFALNPSGYFSSETSQHEKKARFYNNGNSRLLDADRNPRNCSGEECRDLPSFDAGFQRSADNINLQSCIDKDAVKAQALGGWSEPGYGIYVPHAGNAVTGGIYIHGDSDIEMEVDDEHGKAVYTITVGALTKIIKIDFDDNEGDGSTEVEWEWDGGGSGSDEYYGKPDGLTGAGIIIYADGDIDSLGGTVQKDSKVTIAATEDIVITGHILYEQCDRSGPTDARVLNAEAYTNLLGLISWDEDIKISTAAPNDLEIDAVVMAPKGVFTVNNYDGRAPSGYVNLLGGSITQHYGAFGTFSGESPQSGYGRNFLYDRRMMSQSPPYYPTLTYFIVQCSDLEKDVEDMGMIWQDQD